LTIYPDEALEFLLLTDKTTFCGKFTPESQYRILVTRIAASVYGVLLDAGDDILGNSWTTPVYLPTPTAVE
jgi:hypothetical protein